MIAQLDSFYIKATLWKSFTRLLSYFLFEGIPLINRGRWINPLVFSHFALAKKLPQLKNVRKPIFILGTGRSGTTILGKVLSLHRQVGFLNEPKALWHSVYHKEDLVGNYALRQASYRLFESDATKLIKLNFHRLYGEYLTISMCGRVLDKYPELIFRVPFVKAIFPDAKFIFLARNGIDTAISITRFSERHGVNRDHDLIDWWGLNNRKWKLLVEQIVSADPVFENIVDVISELHTPVDKAVVEWISSMNEGLSLLKNDPDSILLTKYETLTNNPNNVLREILTFCELPEDHTLLDYGCKVLVPSSNRGSIVIHPLLKPIFKKTMDTLGYDSDYRY